MGMESRELVSRLIEARQAGRALPAAFYTSPEIFAVDIDVFFKKHWVVVGVDAEIPRKGDLRTVQIGNSSVIFLRDEAGSLKAFHNVCRHRGARLIDVAAGTARRIVCPYHQWSYDLSGNLIAARQMGQDFDKSCHGLKTVHIRSVGGIVMICLADEPPADIEDFAAVVEPRLSPLALDRAKVVHETTIIEQGNWKQSVENNRECYHCTAAHPELCRSLNGLEIGFDPAELTSARKAEWDAHLQQSQKDVEGWEKAGFPSILVERMRDRATIFRTARYTIEGAGEAHTMDTRAACRKLFNGLSNARLGGLHLWTHNSWHHFFADHAVISYIIPLSPGETLLRTMWLVDGAATEEDYDIENLIAVWSATNRQDASLVSNAYKGVCDDAYAPGPLSKFTEDLVDTNTSWYIDRLRVHGL